jgi:hypothetical protein
MDNRLNYRLRAKIREFEALTPLLEELEKEPPKVNKTPEMPVYQQAKPCKQCGKPYLEPHDPAVVLQQEMPSVIP